MSAAQVNCTSFVAGISISISGSSHPPTCVASSSPPASSSARPFVLLTLEPSEVGAAAVVAASPLLLPSSACHFQEITGLYCFPPATMSALFFRHPQWGFYDGERTEASTLKSRPASWRASSTLARVFEFYRSPSTPSAETNWSCSFASRRSKSIR